MLVKVYTSRLLVKHIRSRSPVCYTLIKHSQDIFSTNNSGSLQHEVLDCSLRDGNERVRLSSTVYTCISEANEYPALWLLLLRMTRSRNSLLSPASPSVLCPAPRTCPSPPFTPVDPSCLLARLESLLPNHLTVALRSQACRSHRKYTYNAYETSFRRQFSRI